MFFSRFVEGLESRRLFDAGSADLSFGTNGVVEHTETTGVFRLEGGNVQVSSAGMVLQTEVAVGSTIVKHKGGADVELYRTFPDGTPDTTFGELKDGRVGFVIPQSEIRIPVTNEVVPPIITTRFTPDGGAAVQVGHYVYKFNSSGRNDHSFGVGGRVDITEFLPNAQAPNTGALGMGVDSQGRIIVEGRTLASGSTSRSIILVRRFNPDGTIDKTFGDKGTVTPDLGGSTISAGTFLLHVFPDGSSGLVGLTDPTRKAPNDAVEPVQDYVVYRLDAHGAVTSSARNTLVQNDITTEHVSPYEMTDDGTALFAFVHTPDAGAITFDISGFSSTNTPVTDVIAQGALPAAPTAIIRSQGQFIAILGGDLKFLDAGGNVKTAESTTANSNLGSDSDGDESFTNATVAPDGTLLAGGEFPISRVTLAGGAIAVHRLFLSDSPVAGLISKDVHTARSAAYTFSVDWRDDDGIDTTTLGGDDITVLQPDGSSRRARLISQVMGSNNVIHAVYRFSSPDGAFSSADNGTYTVRVQSQAVKDVHGKAALRQAIGTFNVQIPV